MNIQRLTILLTFGLIATAAAAQDGSQAPEPPDAAPAPGSVMDLQELVRQVSESSGRQFLLDPRVRQVYVGGTPLGEITYPMLLSILRLNGMAAIEIEDRINIVPEAMIRQLAPRIVQTDDPDVADDEWVMRIIDVPDDGVENRAAMLVPILRPMMPQVAHFAAFPQGGKLIIVDRYANVRRITAIVEALTD